MFSTLFVERKVRMDSNFDSSEYKKIFEEKHVGSVSLKHIFRYFIIVQNVTLNFKNLIISFKQVLSFESF